MRIQRPRISQPVITAPTITEVSSLEGDGANITGSFSGSFDGTLTGPTSASFATRLGTIEGDNATQTELDAVSSSLASDVSTNTTNHTTVSSSLATRVSTIEDDNATQTELDSVSSSLASSITANDISALNSFTSSFNTAMSLDSDNVTVLGNLTVQGTQTSLDSATLNVADLNITVASGAADAASANGAGLTVDGASATLTYASTGDKWVFNKDLDLGSNDLTATGTTNFSTLNFGTAPAYNVIIDSDGIQVGPFTVPGTKTLQLGQNLTLTNVSGPGSREDLDLGSNGLYFGFNGSATAPLIYANADSNTGFYKLGSNEFGFTANGSHVGGFDANGVKADSLGVGTDASGTAGEIRATNDITAYYSSDERLKENIVTLDGALDKVKAMRGVTFDWKELSEEERKTIHSHEGHDLGVIAQEVQAQYPELVHQRDHGYLSVDYVKLTAVLIEAVKELAAKVEELSK